MPIAPPLVISRLDWERIAPLLDATGAAAYAELRAELERSEPREPSGMPAEIIGMNCRARFRDVESARNAPSRWFTHATRKPASSRG